MNTPSSDISSGMPTPVSGGAISRAEFADRFRQSSRALWCIAASVCGGRTGAEDAVQEAAVIALGKLGEFTPGTSFVAWMGQIVRFVAMNSARKTGRRDSILRSGAVPGGPDSAPAAPQLELSPPLREAMADLEETARTCLLLRVVGGMSYQQISAAMGIPEGTAMSHVFRARKALAARVDQPEKGGEA